MKVMNGEWDQKARMKMRERYGERSSILLNWPLVKILVPWFKECANMYLRGGEIMNVYTGCQPPFGPRMVTPGSLGF